MMPGLFCKPPARTGDGDVETGRSPSGRGVSESGPEARDRVFSNERATDGLDHGGRDVRGCALEHRRGVDLESSYPISLVYAPAAQIACLLRRQPTCPPALDHTAILNRAGYRFVLTH
jgi:hypothetical protein